MHRYSEIRTLPYRPDQLFALVLDIESYPLFLPWCRAARIVSRGPESLLAELMIRFAHLTERYTSRVISVAPTEKTEGQIDVSLVNGPFKTLENHWRFVPHPEGCIIELDLAFEFKSRMLETLMGGVFERACEKMIGAFIERARALYGNAPVA